MDLEVFRLMILARYERVPDRRKEEYLLSISGKLQGLIGLVVEILKVEGGLHENDGENIHLFVEVVEDELRKAGIPAAARFGHFSGIGDYATQATHPPKLDANA